VKLAASSHELPPSLFVNEIVLDSRDPSFFGGFADVFRGTYRGIPVAVKRPRVSLEADKANFYPVRYHYFYTCPSLIPCQKFCREALIWRQLSHPNILAFVGVDRDTFGTTNHLSMVSHWMPNGTLHDFMKSSRYDPSLHRDQMVCLLTRQIVIKFNVFLTIIL
jgi:serine/threonine protein kinase